MTSFTVFVVISAVALIPGRRPSFISCGKVNELDNDAKFFCFLNVDVRREAAGRLRFTDRKRRFLHHLAFDLLVAESIDLDLRLLPDLDLVDLGLVDLYLDVDRRHIRDRQKSGRRKSGDGKRADFRRDLGDDAIDRSDDKRFVPLVVLTAKDRGLLVRP